MKLRNINIKIKKAAIKDAEKIAVFLRKNFKVHNLNFNKEYIERSMKNGSWLFAQKNKEIIGTILTKIVLQDNRAELKHLFVKQDFRNQGIGKELLSKAIAIAKKKKLRKVTAFAASTDIKALKKLASYFGFKLEGILKNHYRKNENAYVSSLFFQ